MDFDSKLDPIVDGFVESMKLLHQELVTALLLHELLHIQYSRVAAKRRAVTKYKRD